MNRGTAVGAASSVMENEWSLQASTNHQQQSNTHLKLPLKPKKLSSKECELNVNVRKEVELYTAKKCTIFLPS